MNCEFQTAPRQGKTPTEHNVVTVTHNLLQRIIFFEYVIAFGFGLAQVYCRHTAF